MTYRLLRRPDVEAICGLKKSRIDQLERAGEFPQRVRISARACGWRSDEVQEWLDSRPRAADVPADSHAELNRSKRKAA